MNNHLISISDLFKNSFELFKKQWKPLFLISLIVVVVWVIWKVVAVSILAVFGLGAVAIGSASGNFANAFAVGALGLAVLILAWIVAFEIAFWSQAALIVALDWADKGTTSALSRIYAKAKQLIIPLSVVSFLVFVFVAIGLVFLIIPGLILMFLFQFVNFVVVVEGKKGMAVLKRSMNLVNKDFFGVLIRSLCLLIAVWIVNLFFHKVLLFSLLSKLFIVPFSVVYQYLLYKSLASELA